MLPFDPYLNWLGIPPHDQPPNYYRLLGIVLFESNPDAIEQAADRQSLRVGAYQSGPQGEMCQQLLSEIAMARFCLVDPQQKAAYDGQLNESLSQRGERSVAAPPPPAGSQQYNPPPPQFGPPPPLFDQQPAQFGQQPPPFAPPPQFGQQSPQFGQQPPEFTHQGGMGSFHPGMPSPMSVPMPGPAGMPSPQQAMQMPQPGFAAMQRPSTPAGMPVAAPLPAPAAVAVAATPTAPPARPPAPPQRPIDELESLTSQPTTRRRFVKKKDKVDHTKEIVIGTVVGVGAILLLIIYFAVKSQDTSEHGFGGIKPDANVESVKEKLSEERKQKLKELADKKEKEKKAAAAKTSAAGGDVSPLRPFDNSVKRPKNPPADNGAAGLRPFESAPRAFDAPTPSRRIETAPQPDGHDTPLDLGGDNDPVMGPLPGK